MQQQFWVKVKAILLCASPCPRYHWTANLIDNRKSRSCWFLLYVSLCNVIQYKNDEDKDKNKMLPLSELSETQLLRDCD